MLFNNVIRDRRWTLCLLFVFNFAFSGEDAEVKVGRSEYMALSETALDGVNLRAKLLLLKPKDLDLKFLELDDYLSSLIVVLETQRGDQIVSPLKVRDYCELRGDFLNISNAHSKVSIPQSSSMLFKIAGHLFKTIETRSACDIYDVP